VSIRKRYASKKNGTLIKLIELIELIFIDLKKIRFYSRLKIRVISVPKDSFFRGTK